MQTLTTPTTVEIRRRDSYPHDNLGFLQRTHPLRGRPFGRLVYMADSIMQPMKRPGFGMHPHTNVEVVSFVVDGELTHRDSAGNVGVVPAGGFQRITSGTGIEHDESNRTDRPLRMFQIWFEPETLNVDPTYATIETAGRAPTNAFMQVIGSDAEALGINADATISLGRVQQGAEVTIDIAAGRSAMLYVVEGSVALDGAELDRQDQARVSGPVRLRVTGLEPADMLLIESAS